MNIRPKEFDGRPPNERLTYLVQWQPQKASIPLPPMRWEEAPSQTRKHLGWPLAYLPLTTQCGDIVASKSRTLIKSTFEPRVPTLHVVG